MVDPLGLDWYKKNGNVEYKANWHKKHKGYEALGKGNGDWLNYDGKDYNKKTGEVSTTLESVTVTGTRKKDNSLMEQVLHVGNVTQANREAYDARPKPATYDPNPLKTIFWDAGVGLLNPVKDLDVYVSASIKHKTQIGNVSGTLVYGGVQVGVTTASGGEIYGNLITGDNSYLSYKNGSNEIRGLPFRGLGTTIPFFKQPKFGDFAPQLRVISDIAVYRGILIQSELASGKNPSIGLRGKVESPKLLGWSAEVVAGARVSLEAPALYNEIMKYFQK